MGSVSLGVDLSEKGSWLLVISVRVLMGVSASIAANSERNLLLGWIFDWASQGVRLVVWTTALVSINCGGTISLIVCNSRSVRAVNWNLFVVGA